MPPMLAIPFPTWIDPVIVEVGPFALKWYGVDNIAGILMC